MINKIRMGKKRKIKLMKWKNYLEKWLCIFIWENKGRMYKDVELIKKIFMFY
jgi:hypothetical protein